MKDEADLLEQDPFMLEEKRYQDRLKRANIRMSQNYQHLSGKYNI